MKTEFIDVSDTQKHLVVEIPSDVVDAEIDKIARDYGKAARIPGFRPGKVPAKVVRQRFRDQILHDVAHGLIPRAVDDALRERGVEPVDTPDIKDVIVEEGQPLKFTASFETVPPIDPGDYSTLTIPRTQAVIDDEAVDEAMTQLRERAARYEPIEGRGAEHGDSVQLDLERTASTDSGEAQTDRHEGVSVDIGGAANPPGFDDALAGMNPGDRKSFDVDYPDDYAIKELAGTSVKYDAAVKAIRKRVVPELDDEFAKDLGEFQNLEALRARVRADLEHEKLHENERETRGELLKQLAARVTVDVPPTLLEREIDRRVEEFVRRLIEQQVDPMKTNINWEDFREKQRDAAAEAVKSALVLDEVARREHVAVSDADVNEEVVRYAERAGRTPAAVRARLEKEGGLGRVYAGLRRERTVDFLLSRATRV
ncbi:MAG TPA: trigger factor [Vicinamibacterales bacterium]|nr:trigger factor [Vicinamibacterales bacterium]